MLSNQYENVLSNGPVDRGSSGASLQALKDINIFEPIENGRFIIYTKLSCISQRLSAHDNWPIRDPLKFSVLVATIMLICVIRSRPWFSWVSPRCLNLIKNPYYTWLYIWSHHLSCSKGLHFSWILAFCYCMMHIISVFAISASFLPLTAVCDRLSCAQACQEALSSWTFASTNADAGYYEAQCNNVLRVKSVFICVRNYCTPRDIKAGLADLNNTCSQYGSTFLPRIA